MLACPIVTNCNFSLGRAKFNRRAAPKDALALQYVYKLVLDGLERTLQVFHPIYIVLLSSGTSEFGPSSYQTCGTCRYPNCYAQHIAAVIHISSEDICPRAP